MELVDGMEEFFQALGVIGLIILLVVGVLAGVIASTVEGGRNKARNIAIGVVGALLLPFLVALIAAGALATGGLLLILFLALIGAVAVLLIARLVSRWFLAAFSRKAGFYITRRRHSHGLMRRIVYSNANERGATGSR